MLKMQIQSTVSNISTFFFILVVKRHFVNSLLLKAFYNIKVRLPYLINYILGLKIPHLLDGCFITASGRYEQDILANISSSACLEVFRKKCYLCAMCCRQLGGQWVLIFISREELVLCRCLSLAFINMVAGLKSVPCISVLFGNTTGGTERFNTSLFMSLLWRQRIQLCFQGLSFYFHLCKGMLQIIWSVLHPPLFSLVSWCCHAVK